MVPHVLRLSASLWGKSCTMAGKGFDFDLTEEKAATSSQKGHYGCKAAITTQKNTIQTKILGHGMMCG